MLASRGRGVIIEDMAEQPQVDLGMRALGMMQALMAGFAEGESLSGPERGIVDQRTAADAILLAAATVDEWLQEGLLPPGKSTYVMTMLMVVREHILSLPEPPGDEALLRADLSETVEMIRQVRQGYSGGESLQAS
jgi:hypothetical protein